MDRSAGARKLITELVKAEHLEVRRAEIVGRDLAKLCETLKRAPTAEELEDWLGDHAQVTEVYAPRNVLDELIDRHLTPPADPNVAGARNPELEQQIRDAPEAAGGYAVYADWLQEHGDPLGELITLSIAAAGGDEDATTRFERHLKRHEGYLLGEVAGQASRFVLRWRHGFIQGIEEGAERVTPALWRQLLGLRVCELVESITLHEQATDQLAEAIAEAAPATMRSLVLENCAMSLPAALMKRPLRALALHGHVHGALALESGALPASLERLELRLPRPSVTAPPLVLEVRELVIALNAQTADFLVGVRIPNVERLALHLEPATVGPLPGLLTTLAPPALRHLALHDDLPLAALAAIAELPFAAQIASLALVNVDLTDELVPELAAPLRRFTALAELDVSFNELTRDGLAAARALAPTVTSQRQNRRGNSSERRVRKFAGSRLNVAEQIADPKAWKRAFVDGDLRWARYRGEQDYELFVSADLSRHGCTCPSSIRPCKHVVALALLAERQALPAAPSNRIEERLNLRLRDQLLESIDPLERRE